VTLHQEPTRAPEIARSAVADGAADGEIRRDAHSDAGQHGMVTVEYAIGTMAAAALATLLWTIAHSPFVLRLIEQVFARALTLPR
jgi:hypothetical protein